MATYGVIGSPTYAVAINNLGGMLNVLPDNSANLIDAQDVRDVVAGLYENIEGLSSSVALIGTTSVTYTNTNPTSVELGGIQFNSTFTGLTVQQIFDQLFYPYTAPTLTFSVSPTIVEYGNNSTSAVLDWSITSGINNISSSIIYRPLQPLQAVSTPTAFNSASGNLGSNTLILNTPTTFTFSVNDGFLTYSSTASVTWSNRRYWGTLGISSPLVTTSTSTFSYSDINTLNSELNEIYSQSREIMSNNDYVVFIWPSNSVNLESTPPKVTINGMPNNDWTKTRNGVLFTNQYGYTASYDVWRFNNTQGSFTSSYVITI